jgi:hypothetical protein
MSLAELERVIPCSTGAASIITRRLTAAALLKRYAPEYGLPVTFTLDRAALRALLVTHHYGQLLSVVPAEMEQELQAASR